MAEKKIPGVVLYFAIIGSALDLLTDEQIATLIRALFNYAQFGTVPELSDTMLTYMFRCSRLRIDADQETFRERSEKARYAASCRGKKKSSSQQVQADASVRKREQTDESERSHKIEKEDNKTKENKKKDITCAEPEVTGSTLTVISMLLKDGSEYPVSQSDVDEWAKLFPTVDVMQQLRAMKAWCIDNPAKRKTKTGIRRFISGWFTRQVNNGQKPAEKKMPDYSFEMGVDSL